MPTKTPATTRVRMLTSAVVTLDGGRRIVANYGEAHTFPEAAARALVDVGRAEVVPADAPFLA